MTRHIRLQRFLEQRKQLFKLIPVSISGTIIGHVFVYRHLFYGVSDHHTDQSTNVHAYFWLALIVCALLSVLSVVIYFRLGQLEKKSKQAEIHISFSKTVASLFFLQLLLFLSMEVLEQATIDLHHVFEFFRSNILIFGLLFQLVSATLVSLIMFSAKKLGLILSKHRQAKPSPFRKLLSIACASHRQIVITQLAIRAPPMYAI